MDLFQMVQLGKKEEGNEAAGEEPVPVRLTSFHTQLQSQLIATVL